MFAELVRPRLIIGALPVTLTNGTTADATQVMSDLNWIVNQVNANAADLANTAVLNANNNFTTAQSGIAATDAANFPIASQIQNVVFNTLSSTLGTNTLTARVAALPLTAYATGQIFAFVPSQTNTGPPNITIDSAGSSIIYSGGVPAPAGALQANVPAALMRAATQLHLLGPTPPRFAVGSFTRDTSLASGTQQITGVGFKPKSGMFVQVANATSSFSVGLNGDPGNAFVAADNAAVSAGTWAAQSSQTIESVQGVGVVYQGTVLTWDADGFTLSWVKTGAAAGVVSIYYLVFA